MDRNSAGNLTVQVRLHDSIVGRGALTEKTSFRGDALFKDMDNTMFMLKPMVIRERP